MNQDFINFIGGYCMPIQNYTSNNRIIYISPANSLGFMDGGIDHVLSRIMFPGLETKVKNSIKQLGIKNRLGRNYLPIGKAILVDNVIVSPTMLLPQNVSETNNAEIATMAIMKCIEYENINLENTDIIITSLCMGYGQMKAHESARQIQSGIKNYKNFIFDNDLILLQQPKYYQNTEWIDINYSEIRNV